MRLGTKSVLFGCHQFIIHPIFVLWGWIALYGWRSLNFQVLIAIAIHDLGYWGCQTMDGPDGSLHPQRSTRLLGRRFGWAKTLILGHSRHTSPEPSLLCWADKLSLVLIPSWLWAFLAYLSGEGREYIDNPYQRDYVVREPHNLRGLIRFHQKIRVHIRRLLVSNGQIPH